MDRSFVPIALASLSNFEIGPLSVLSVVLTMGDFRKDSTVYLSYLSFFNGLGEEVLFIFNLFGLRRVLERFIVFCFCEDFPLSGGSSFLDALLCFAMLTFQSQKLDLKAVSVKPVRALRKQVHSVRASGELHPMIGHEYTHIS